MLVILTDEQIISTQQVCSGCLLANRQGTPRWNKGKLGCGHSLARASGERANLYECQMGFLLANIDE
jgi:hypothetical protein